VVTAALGIFLIDGSLTTWSFMAFVLVAFFLASAGASSAYLTVSEIFPMETRALSIAFFYAVGTAVGGISGPLLFGHLIESGESATAVGFFIGAGVMAIGGIAELFFGVPAEQKQLEHVAEPLTATEVEGGEGAEGAPAPEREPVPARASHARRYRLGPSRIGRSPGMPVSEPWLGPDVDVDREVGIIAHALEEKGNANRRELRQRVGARYWGPGRFRAALRQAVAEGKARRLRGGEYVASHD
jgi:hypothetical protein